MAKTLLVQITQQIEIHSQQMHNTSTRCGAVQCGLFSQVKNGTTCAPQTVMPPNSTINQCELK